MTVKEAAAYLAARGYRCAMNTVRALARAGRLRHYRVGVTGRGRMEFTATALDAFLKDAEVGSAPAGVEGPSSAPAPRLRVAPRPMPAAGRPDPWREELEREVGS